MANRAAPLDNYATHKKAEVKDWLAKNPPHPCAPHPDLRLLTQPRRGLVRHHRTPSHPSHRGSFGSVNDLNAKIRAFINGWNDRAHPFVWTTTADEILKKAKRRTTSNTAH